MKVLEVAKRVVKTLKEIVGERREKEYVRGNAYIDGLKIPFEVEGLAGFEDFLDREIVGNFSNEGVQYVDLGILQIGDKRFKKGERVAGIERFALKDCVYDLRKDFKALFYELVLEKSYAC